MADRVDSGSRLHLSPPPHQISKDTQGFDNSIPLSPQWLLPKPAESKHGIGAGGNCVNQNIPHGNPPDMLTLPGNGENLHETHKKKDVFRPSMLDSDSSRRDRWRDEERDTKSLVRKDRWRDGEKDISETRRVDRWSENSSARQFGDARRMTSERKGDSSNRDTNYDQRRESKWNTRWGPDDRGLDSSREKLNESGKYVDIHLEKGLPHLASHGKDEREEDQTRSWRSSSVQSRGRADSAHHQSITPNKLLYTVAHGRGRGENTQPLFSHERGWLGSSGSTVNVTSHSQPQGPNPGEVDNGHGELNPSSYGRTKLLDVYRATSLTALRKSIDDFVQVPPITLDEPLDPLALCAPNSEEMTVLKGIENGDVTGSGAPQVTKDVRNSTDFTYSRRTKLGGSTLQGSREDLSSPYDEGKDSSSEGQRPGFLNYSEEASVERLNTRDEGHDKGPRKTADDMPTSRELSVQGSRRNHPLGERSNGLLHDSREISSDTRPRNCDMGWPQQSKDPHNNSQGHLFASSDRKDVTDWKNSEDPVMKRQPSGAMDRELEARKVSQTNPEELSLLYRDPQGQIRGPFKGIDIIGWFEAGYFGIDLPVCLDSVLGNSPWSTLGDVMPHLRAKARPPPGFSLPKQNEYADVQNRLSISPLMSNQSGRAEFEMLRNDASHRQGSKTEAENRFLESLMSSNMSSSTLDSIAFSEGFQGYVGNNPGNMMPPGVDNANNVYLLTKRMALERQRSLTNPYAYWTGNDAGSLVSNPEYISETLAQHAKLLSPVDDNARQQHTQNAQLVSILHGLSDRPPSGINSGAPGWSNFPVQGGVDSLQNKIDIPPQVPFDFQQQRQPQNQPSLSNLLAPGIDNPSGILTAEKLLSSGLPQDPQLLNMLQQQYLLSQAGMPQMSPLDKMLLLKQQQLLRQQQQQQQLLSQVLSEHQTQQRFGEPSFGQLPLGGMTSFDPSQLPQTIDAHHIVSQAPISGLKDDWNNNMVNVPSKYVQESIQNVVSEPSALHLPHQLYGNTTHGKSLGTTILEQLNVVHPAESLPTFKFVENLSLHEDGSKLGTNIFENPLPVSGSHVTETLEKASESTCSDDLTVAATFSEASKNPLSVEVTPSAVAILAVDSELPPSSTTDTTPKVQLNNSREEAQAEIKKQGSSPVVTEVPEPKKSSNKKSKKQKSSKSLSADIAKVPSQQSKLFEAEKRDGGDSKSVKGPNAEAYEASSLQNLESSKQHTAVTDVCDTKFQDLSASVSGGSAQNARIEGSNSRSLDSASTRDSEPQTGQRAWKPAPGMKPKSLLEIQMEEQMKAQKDTSISENATPVNAIDLPTPWSGVVANSDSVKASNESVRGAGNNKTNLESAYEIKSKKSHLHDLLAEEVLKKSGEREAAVSDGNGSFSFVSSQTETADDENFIDAKDSKRSRKKSAKSKNTAAKAVTVVAVDVLLGSSSTEKSKSSRTSEQDKEVLPPIPAGPSLGDYVLWKGEPNSSPSPAWSTDSNKVPNKTSLRDILKEQKEKKVSTEVHQNRSPIPQKPQASRSVPASSPTKAASPLQISAPSAQPKFKADDELFWGPVEQSKQETNRFDFPHLASQGSWGSKIAPSKGTSLSRQKSASNKSTERLLSSSPAGAQSSLKGKRDAMTKHSEAMGFKEWCESECARIIGNKDTSFLEYCLKLPRSEAETLLKENLESRDPDFEFVEKFLNYKEMLPSDVIEMAFQSELDQKFPRAGAVGMNSYKYDIQQIDGDNNEGHEGLSKGGGKKKSKKGKKINPSVLGFNVVSNRIMMGEIQTLEE